MKIRHLPAIDLANIASLPYEQRREKLEKQKETFITWSYNPTRELNSDIFNCHTSLFGPIPRPTWENIRISIASKSRSAEEYKHNLSVSKTLYDFCTSRGISSRHREFFPISLGLGKKIEFWSPLVLVSESRPIVPFVDPRLGEKLTKTGRRFAFSVMHERIRAADPDFCNARLLIIQFVKDTLQETGRRIIEHYDDDIEMMSFDELDHSVSETYALWQEILLGREEKRRTSGKRGSLL